MSQTPVTTISPVTVEAPRLSRWQRWRFDLGALLFFGIMSFVLLWPLSDHLAVSTNNEGDALAQIWIMGWGSHSLTHDPANFFNGNIFYPYSTTLAYADALVAQTLQALPVYLLTGNLVLGYGLLTLFSFIWNGWATYLLVKESGGGRAGGLFAGMVFAFASYKIGHLSQLNLLSTQWIPFCFLFLRRLMMQDVTGRWAKPFRQGWLTVLAFTFFFVLNALSTFYYLFYLLPLLAIYFLVFYIGQQRWPGWAFWLKLVVAGLVSLALILPILLPYATVAAEQNAQRTVRDVEEFSANYRFYIGAAPNNLLWGSSLSRFAGNGGERMLFPGALAYLLAALSLLGPLLLWLRSKTRRSVAVSTSTSPALPLTRERWVWSIIILFSLMMSFGWTLHLKGWDIPGIYRLFYSYIPGWQALRAAGRYGMFVLLGIAVLGGLAVGWLSRRESLIRLAGRVRSVRLRNWSLSGPKLLGIGLTVLLLAGAFWEYRYDISYINPNILPNPPAVYHWLAQPGHEGVVLELPAPADPVNPPSIRNYYTTFNWQPYVGGLAANIPPVETDIDRLINQFPSPEGLSLFQGMGVRWLVFFEQDENTPFAAGQWEKIQAQLQKTPQVKLAQDFPQDHVQVYELTADPWMKQATASLPANGSVIVSDYRQLQSTPIEIMEAQLRRDGHALYGSGRAGYRFLSPPPTGQPVTAGLFAADEDPTLYGFATTDQVWRGHGLGFYQRKETLDAAYDLSNDYKLTNYAALTSPLDLAVSPDGLKFNNNAVGSGASLSGTGQIKLLLSSFVSQTVQLNGASITLPAGLSEWSSDRLTPGQTVRIEPAAGQTLYLNRAELVTFDPASTPGLKPVAGATLLKAATTQQKEVLTTELTAWTPPISDKAAGSYIMTLDIYRRPWGAPPNGHYGTYSVALTGQNQAHTIGYDFNPGSHVTQARVDGAGVGIGSQVFPSAGDGEWTAFITLRRSNPANAQDFPLIGQTSLYDFGLDSGVLSDLTLQPGHELILLPPLNS